MLLTILAALMILAEAPAATAAPVAPVAPPPADPVIAAPVDPVIAQIDALMTEKWKGKRGDGLRGRLGLTHQTKPAKDGEVVFWLTKSESMGCGIDASGAMRCGTAASAECALGVAFEKDGKVRSWKAQGSPDACRNFVAILAKP